MFENILKTKDYFSSFEEVFLRYPFAVISNQNSKKNKLGIITPEDLTSVFSDDQCYYFFTKTPDDLERALEFLAAKQVELIFSNGGDGTHQKLIDKLIKKFPNYHPIIVTLRGGTMNMLANNFNIPLTIYDTMSYIKNTIETDTPVKVVKRPVVKIEILDKNMDSNLSAERAEQSKHETTHYGFALTLGFLYNILKVYYSYKKGGVGTVTRAISKTVWGWLIKDPKYLSLKHYINSRTIIDDKEVNFPYFVAIVSTIPRLIMRFSPFATNPFNKKKLFFIIDGEPMYKNYNLLKLYKLSRKEEWKEKRIVSKANYIELDVEEGFSLDGEMFPLTQRQRVAITTGPDIRFLINDRLPLI